MGIVYQNALGPLVGDYPYTTALTCTEFGYTFNLYPTARTNYIPNSGTLTGWSSNNLNAISPVDTIGGFNVYALIATAVSSQHFISVDMPGLTDNMSTTFNVVMDNAGEDSCNIRLRTRDGASAALTSVDFVAQTATGGATITAITGGYWLIKIPSTNVLAGATVPRFYIYPRSSAVYTGDGVKGVRVGPVWTSDGVYIVSGATATAVTDYTYNYIDGSIVLSRSLTGVKSDGVACQGSGTSWQRALSQTGTCVWSGAPSVD